MNGLSRVRFDDLSRTHLPGLAALVDRLRGRRGGTSMPRLHRGLAFPRDKPGLDDPIVEVPVPPLLFIPLLGYRGRALVPRVAAGQSIARGELLASGLPASAAGTVRGIERHPVAHPAGRDAPCIVLATEPVPATSAPHRPVLAPLAELTLARLARCGVGGLGGAGFPTHEKFADPAGDGIHTVVVNAAECEPGIACDEALIGVAAAEIVAGALDLAQLAGAERCLVVVESDKRAARAALARAIAAADPGARELRLLDIAPLYPSGAERLLLRLATGRDVPPGERPARHGLLCVNVATARAARLARLGVMSFERIVTVAGDRATHARHARVTFGTPLADVLDATGQAPRAADTRRRVGGPLSGFDVASERVPVTATVNRVALESPRPPTLSAPCIRCAACSDVCPVDLLPQELLRHARAGADDALDRGGLDACLECGCCDVVCPSAIPLTATFRHARGARLDAHGRALDAARAEAAFRRREARQAGRNDVTARNGTDGDAAGSSGAVPPGTASSGAASSRTTSSETGPSGAASSSAAPESPASAPVTPDTVRDGGAPAVDDVAAALARARARRRRTASRDDGTSPS